MPMISLPRQIALTQRFSVGVPSQFTVSRDGSRVLFLRSKAGDDPVRCLWLLDPDSGTERLLADPAQLLGGGAEELSEEERTRRERERDFGAGIAGYAIDTACRLVAFALSGQLWAVDTGGGEPRRLPATGSVMDPRPDPTGRWIAYVAGGALRVIGADSTGDRVLAAPDGPDVGYGLPEHVASESMGRSRGYWWAPDGTRILVARVDNAKVGIWYIADPADPAKPPRAVRYPAVGTANAEVTLWIAGLDGGLAEVSWDIAAYEYVPTAGWDAHGPFATVESRGQGTMLLLGIDPADGTTRVLDERRDRYWVSLVPGLPVRTASGALLWFAEDGETRHLTVDGSPVTPPGLQLQEVLGVDGDEVLFLASTEPTQCHLWSYRAVEGPRQLSTEAGVHHGVRRGGTLVHLERTLDRPGTRITVRKAPAQDAGGRAVTVASLAQAPVAALHMTPLALGPRELRSHLFLPSWHTPGQPLPVLLDPYSGPGLQKVTAEQTWSAFVSQWFAEQGFAVLVTDGRGTPGRGPLWEREIYGNVFGPALEDQVTAVTEAAKLNPDLDLGRVGIRGWSYSGALAALAVLRRPDVFRAAVAGAAVSDQRMYDTNWRERFLGHPARYPEHYEACSLLLEAPNLARPLLLIHGLADDNVFPANTLRLSSALLAGGRPHEVLLLTGVTHSTPGETLYENLLLHQAGFLRRHLGVPDRP